MSKKKVFYWIKLNTDYFKQDEIDFLMTMPNGSSYVLIFQMLCLETANTEGKLVSIINGSEVPYDNQKIARETRYFDRETVENAIDIFMKIGLIKKVGNKTLQIVDYENMIGSETNWAKQKRNQALKDETKP